MKTLTLLLCFLVTFISFGQETESTLKWHSLAEAQELQKENPKKGILIDFYTSWCGPCKMMMKNTFTDASVIEYLNENFYIVKFNAEGNETVTFKGKTYKNPSYDPERANARNGKHQFTSANGIAGYPTIVYYDKNNKLNNKIVGYKTAEQLLIILKQLE